MSDSEKKSKQISVQSVQEDKDIFSYLQEDFNRAFRNFSKVVGFRNLPFENFENLSMRPSVDILDDKGNFKVEIEMPGMSEKEINVSIQDDYLLVEGEKKISSKDEEKNYIMREIGYGHYKRVIPLARSLDIEKAKASFKKGMLWVTIPQKNSDKKKSHQIKIEKVDS